MVIQLRTFSYKYAKSSLRNIHFFADFFPKGTATVANYVLALKRNLVNEEQIVGIKMCKKDTVSKLL